jgi:hypothetical protein
MGTRVEPSKQRLDAYLAEWVARQRLIVSTLGSYRKYIRLHIDPYLGETAPLRAPRQSPGRGGSSR